MFEIIDFEAKLTAVKCMFSRDKDKVKEGFINNLNS